MTKAPDDAALNAKLVELLASPQMDLDGATNAQIIDVSALDVELTKIEMLLDQLEEQDQFKVNFSSNAPRKGEISYL